MSTQRTRYPLRVWLLPIDTQGERLRPKLPGETAARITVLVALIFGGVWATGNVTGSPIPLVLVGGVLLFATVRPFRRR